ncbi:MAG: hydrogenase maturation protein HypF [Actinomycetota bacterium]|jgi:hydrogenase maturation protein HypF|nr:hydrogenase maturation protein HypF [Actinomycetota bacterium]
MGFERHQLRVTGTVQGVGFRPFVYRLAVELGLTGSVANDSRGVIIDVEAPADALDRFAERLVAELPPLAMIESLVVEAVDEPLNATSFTIVDSRVEGTPAVAVSVDVATCADCTRELLDPADRRFGYPFINCTNCGPRYTIILSIPYDRPATTMAGFVLCDECRAEYTDPANRRFHAEPVCCPVCGPQLSLLAADGALLAKADDALDQTVALLAAGKVLAIKGLGGYHLSVDAGNPDAVAELRRRKARDDKPFAVMVGDLDEARRVAHVSAAAEAEMASVRRPIVLVPRRDDSGLAPRIAPRLPELGLMLPYTPLHTLLLHRFGGPLVMTSGNLSDEPIAHDDTDALARLGPMVDAILTHDRPIHIRCDDSVVRARPAGKPVQMLRRSRGYAPAPIPLALPTNHQVLAVGAELKNTVTVAKGTNLIASHHIGDLEHLAAYKSFLQAVDHLCHLTGVVPEVVAHDLHPEYLSTKFAVELDLPTLGVQHHHAHIASCLAEHRRDDRVLGIAFDGTGMGTDGVIWGGEFLVADLESYQRVGHLAAVALPGGVRAVREPWRMALAWARTALGREEAERYGRSVDERWPSILSIIEREDSLRTTSAGRLFDGVAALLGIRPTVTYEAQAAIELEAAAAGEPLDTSAADGWEASVTAGDDGCAVLDPSPLVAHVVAARDRGASVPAVAAAFHAALGRSVAAMAGDLAAAAGVGTVALSGGVFQNARLTEVVERDLTASGVEVLIHSRVPPNDGGVSIGQAAVAARWRG